MGNEKVRYAVFLRDGGFAHQTFWTKDRGVVINERPALECSEVDLSGIHVRLRVVLRDTGDIRAMWVQSQDVVAVIERDADGKVGF